MADPAERQKRKTALYAEVHRCSQNSDYDKMLKSCNRLLHEFPDEETAFEAKIMACVQLSKFKEALDFISKNPKLSGNLSYEKAYCCYRLNDVELAEDILAKSPENSPRKMELLAQVYYRQEKFEKCYDLYREVIKNSNDEWDSERQTNLLAIAANLGFHGIKKSVPITKGDTYEHCYNAGCVLVSEDKFTEADTMLKSAENECIQFLEEDGTAEEEIEDELAIIRTQLGYCAQKLGRPKEAMHVYSKVLKNKPSDAGIAAVAANNILSLNKDQNIFDSKKRIKTINSEGVETRTTRKQRYSMKINQCLFNLHTNSMDACKTLYEELTQEYPEQKEELILIRAAIVAKTEGFDETKKFLDATAKQNPKTALYVRLGLIQQILRSGKRREAINLLQSLGKDMYLPGIVSALVTLYQADGEADVAGKLIRDAIEYYRTNKTGAENMNVLWQQSVALMMEKGDYRDAIKSLEEQQKLQPDNLSILAQLVIAYAKVDVNKAEQLTKRLPSPSSDGYDVASLESPNWQVNLKMAKKTQKADSVPTSPVKAAPNTASSDNFRKVKPKKTKKKKLPPHIDPKNTPDPERWLPKYERTGYKPKKNRNKGKVDVGKGTQGATSEAAAQFDMTAKVKTGQQTNSPGGGDATASSSGGFKKDQKNKKKKKR